LASIRAEFLIHDQQAQHGFQKVIATWVVVPGTERQRVPLRQQTVQHSNHKQGVVHAGAAKCSAKTKSANRKWVELHTLVSTPIAHNGGSRAACTATTVGRAHEYLTQIVPSNGGSQRSSAPCPSTLAGSQSQAFADAIVLTATFRRFVGYDLLWSPPASPPDDALRCLPAAAAFACFLARAASASAETLSRSSRPTNAIAWHACRVHAPSTTDTTKHNRATVQVSHLIRTRHTDALALLQERQRPPHGRANHAMCSTARERR
jgi:hypothetical protein